MQDNLTYAVANCVKDILREVTQISPKDMPDIIWHYTNRDTLFKILETREIWSTHVSCLNDTSECLILHDKLIEEFKSRNCELFHALLSQIEPKMLNKHFIMDSKWFVCSFSRNEDDQKLWDRYASGEAGCAIGFDPRKLLAWINYNRLPPGTRSHPTLSLSQVLELSLILDNAPILLLPTYYDETIQRSFVKNIADEILKHWNNASLSDEEYWAVWEDQLSVVAPLFKHDQYQYENELRLLHQLASGEECKLKYQSHESMTTRHLPLCYTEYFPIQRIIVAQCRDQELTNRSVENLKEAVDAHIAHAYANRLIRPVITVGISKLPFRSQ